MAAGRRSYQYYTILTLPSSDRVLTLKAEQPLCAPEPGVCNEILSSDFIIQSARAVII